MEKKRGKGSKTKIEKGKNKRLRPNLSKSDKITEKSAGTKEKKAAEKIIEIKKDEGLVRDTDLKKEQEKIVEEATKKVIGDDLVKEERVEAISEEGKEATGPEGDQKELLSFFLADEEYAIDIMIIKEIIRIMDITFVPRAHDFIKGIVSLRGIIVPIFDLRRRLGLSEPSASKESRIIVVTVDNEMLGIVVDGVAEVVKISGADIEPTPFTIGEIDAEYIKGVVRYKERIVILLDILRLLELQEGKSLR